MNSETDIKTALLLNGIIALMNNLQMEIVIEGVEHKNQVELLKSYNCDYLQGYYFSKPIKEEDFIESMLSYIK
jgi:EAL domain-containing protein (putative c-di-GMP-specific phosphodiesterase class I)